MDSEGRIYRAPEGEIPADDKARLEGYLNAKAEDATLSELKAKIAELEKRLRGED